MVTMAHLVIPKCLFPECLGYAKDPACVSVKGKTNAYSVFFGLNSRENFFFFCCPSLSLQNLVCSVNEGKTPVVSIPEAFRFGIGTHLV